MTTTESTIAEQVVVLQQAMAAKAPAEVLAVFHAEQLGLATAGLPGGIPELGTPMPDGALLDAHSRPTTLEAARGGKPAVVVFYRGAWCPYCDVTLRTYQATLQPELKVRGIELIAISPQKPDGSLSMQETKELTFTVLSDPGNQIAAELGILTAPTADARAAQAAVGLDLPAMNADGTDSLPMPTVVIVDADSAIRWIDVHPDYTTRSEVSEILAALDATIV